MKVSACLVTRGSVDMQPVIDSLPPSWEVVIWDNSGTITRSDGWAGVVVKDMLGYGRHAAIEHATGDLIWTCDDDVIVSDPQAIVDAWIELSNWENCLCIHWNTITPGCPTCDYDAEGFYENVVVCNLPSEFRPHYPDSGMLGFGSCFHRDTPKRVFDRFLRATGMSEDDPLFLREADRALTVLSPLVLVDVPVENREFANDDNRLWKQPDHVEMREKMLTLARQVRDA